MVYQRKSHQREGHGRDHQVPIRGRHGDSRRPASSGLESIIKGLLKDLEPFLRRVLLSSIFPHTHAPLQTANPPGMPSSTFSRYEKRWSVKYRNTCFQGCGRATPCEGGASGSRPLELRFINNPLGKIFTLSEVIAEDKVTALQIVLFDVRSQSVVSDGPLSSAKVEIFAVEGDFCSQMREDWTEEEFNANILTPREGKGPLLNGDRIITLKNGFGSITNVKITDNSSWGRSKKFSLGVKVLQPTSCEPSIKEGVSKPFRVKDNRGELYKKHHPPRLDDDVWRLEKIAKNGIIYQRLCEHGIRTVRDLVQSYNIDPSSLLAKVGQIPRKSWEAITEHAKKYVVDYYNLYMYQTAEQPSVGLLFDSSYTLVGVTFDGQNYSSPDTLAPDDKRLVEVVKRHAYRNLNDLKAAGDLTRFNFQRSLTYPQAGQGSGPDQGLQQPNFPIAQQGQIGTWAGFDQPSASYADEGMQYEQTYAGPFPDLPPMQQNCPAEGEWFPGMQMEGNNIWPNVESHWMENENPQIPFTDWGQQNGFHFNPYGEAEFGRSEKPKAVWYKIRAALKWVITVRRDAAARRTRLFYYNG